MAPILSVNLIAPLITCLERGFHLYVWKEGLAALPAARLVTTRLHRCQDKSREPLPETAWEERETGMSK